MKDEKTCTNCGYFVQYYTKFHAYFIPVPCGLCKKRNLTAKEKRSIPSITNCAEWIPMEEQLEKRRAEICEVLQSLADRIDTISQILLDDEGIKKSLHK